VPHLEFEDGNLVKCDGQRPQYMDGYRLIALVKDLGREVFTLREKRAKVAYHLSEIEGCLEEYEAMPCASLRARLRGAVARAKAAS
jgi:hypothetical protein